MSEDAREPVVVAIDPGGAKCGLAVVHLDGQAITLDVLPLDKLRPRIAEATSQFFVTAVLVGDSTGHKAMLERLSEFRLPVAPELVCEKGSTLRARQRYFDDHPPRGWRKLVPNGMLLPPRPVDDYAALVIAEDWLAQRATEATP